MKRFVKYACAAVFVGLTVWLYLGPREFDGAEPLERYRMLSDAFTVPGVLLLMLGCLCRIGDLGALDGVAYALTVAFRSLTRFDRGVAESYGDFVARKRERRKKGYGFLLLSGGVTLAVAVVFLILFYRLY